MIGRELPLFEEEGFKEILKNYLHDRILERCYLEKVELICSIEDFVNKNLEDWLNERLIEKVTLEELQVYANGLDIHRFKEMSVR